MVVGVLEESSLEESLSLSPILLVVALPLTPTLTLTPTLGLGPALPSPFALAIGVGLERNSVGLDGPERSPGCVVLCPTLVATPVATFAATLAALAPLAPVGTKDSKPERGGGVGFRGVVGVVVLVVVIGDGSELVLIHDGTRVSVPDAGCEETGDVCTRVGQARCGARNNGVGGEVEEDEGRV